MKYSVKLSVCLLTTVLLFQYCSGQQPVSVPNLKSASPLIGGPFENSDFGLIGQPEELFARDTSMGWYAAGHQLIIEGTVFKIDGKTPVPNVVLYYYHTDTAGYYSPGPNLPGTVVRHGYLRGWVKTDAKGRYAIHTSRPGAYPNRRDPAHLHVSVYEPGIPNPYYLDGWVFDDDPLLTSAKRRTMTNRGGSGVLRLRREGNVQVARHNVILGLNIPYHPDADKGVAGPGPAIGEDLTSFSPYHVWGPDAGTRACPICKYGKGSGAVFFVGTDYDPEALEEWLLFFESLAQKEPDFRTFFVFPGGNARRKSLESLGRSLGLTAVALTVVPAFSDEESEIYRYGFERPSGNLLLIYRGSNVVDRYLDVGATLNVKELIGSSVLQAGN